MKVNMHFQSFGYLLLSDQLLHNESLLLKKQKPQMKPLPARCVGGLTSAKAGWFKAISVVVMAPRAARLAIPKASLFLFGRIHQRLTVDQEKTLSVAA
jgi:hypothetical protein